MVEQRAEGFLRRVLDRVPGYSGYRDKENRRDADRAVRDRLARELRQRAERVTGRARALADERRIEGIGAVNAVSDALGHLADRVESASYGYGGLFGNRDVDADAIDQLRLFDESLFAGLEQVDTALTALEQSDDAGLIQTTAEAQNAIEAMGSRFDERTRVIESGSPATGAALEPVLTVLQTPEERAAASAPSPAFDLHDRDALAVLGTNYVVDARIDVESATRPFRLFRVDVAPDRWLFAERRAGVRSALLSLSTDQYVPSPAPRIGDEPFAIEASGTGSGDAVGAGGQSGRRPVAFTLLRGQDDDNRMAVVLQWGSESQVFVGSAVHPDDIEVFGKPI
jgi:hypothetical protein